MPRRPAPHPSHQVKPQLAAAVLGPDEQAAAAHEYEELLSQIRKLPGLEGFQRPRPFHSLSECTAGGPVVILNVGRLRSDALILREGSLRVLELTSAEFNHDTVVDRTNTYLRALLEAQSRTPAAVANLGHVLDTTLTWLWRHVTRPVLATLLDLDSPPTAENWPRLWWCPTGPLSLMPLHAAGDHAQPGEAVIERVVSSYTFSLTALIDARRRHRPSERTQPSILAVGVPTTATPPGLPDLPGVPRELGAIAARFQHLPSTILDGPRALADVTLAKLSDHQCLHLACHGGQVLDDPAQGSVFLYDRPISVTEIASQHLDDAELAFLSACQTGIGGIRLTDESLHLAAAFQLAGYRNVVATIWSIRDADASGVTDAFYGAYIGDGKFAPRDAAAALHRAVTQLRSRHRDDPRIWAMYIHTGP